MFISSSNSIFQCVCRCCWW